MCFNDLQHEKEIRHFNFLPKSDEYLIAIPISGHLIFLFWKERGVRNVFVHKGCLRLT